MSPAQEKHAVSSLWQAVLSLLCTGSAEDFRELLELEVFWSQMWSHLSSQPATEWLWKKIKVLQ